MTIENMHKDILFQSVLDSIDVGVHVIDEFGVTIFYNKKMGEIEGMKCEEVLHRDIRDVFSFPQYGESTLLYVLNSQKNMSQVRQSYFNEKGQEITTLNTTSPIFNHEKMIGAIEISRDVTKLQAILHNSLSKGETKYSFESIIGHNSELLEVIQWSKRALRTNSSILIIGETGTGKELFAQSIHNNSPRAAHPYISQNCAAIPDTLMESILFGTVKGAFTGAIDRPGLFQQANGGTLLLDEINMLTPSLQAKLLRVIQERTYRRIGDHKDCEIDVRIVATINEDPIRAVNEGRLRKDLFYRLSVVSLFIPPLRERKDDIGELVQFFIHKYNHLFHMSVMGIDTDLQMALMNYDWPGNVRELEHLIEGAMNLMEQEEVITLQHIPFHLRQKPQFKTEGSHETNMKQLESHTLEHFLHRAEINFLKKALEKCKGNVTNTAKMLGMSRQNLQYRLRKYRIEKHTKSRHTEP